MFVTAKDEEPEFVEWGYGGMGSVKAGKQNGNTQWSRVQSDKAMMAMGGTGVDDNLDDGGGMEWVRRRKEKKEREKREEEERARAEAAGVSPAVDNQASDPPPHVEEQSSKGIVPSAAETTATAVSPHSQPLLQPTPLNETPTPIPTPAPASQEPNHYITTTVTVPAPTRPHHHRTGSVNTNTSHSQVNLPEEREQVVVSPVGGSFGGAGGGVRDVGIESVGVSGVDENVDDADASESESESESDDDDEPEDEDEDEVSYTFIHSLHPYHTIYPTQN
jgi:hypothetical protein